MSIKDFFGFVAEEDHERWEKLEASAQRRSEQGGGIGRIAQEAAKPGLEFAQQAISSKTQAAQIAQRDDARETRRKRTVVNEQTEFVDEEPEFG